MHFNQLFVFTIFASFVSLARALPTHQDYDDDTAESNFANSYISMPLPSSNPPSSFRITAQEPASFFTAASVAAPAIPALEVSVDKKAAAAPKVQIIRLLEAFFKLKGESLLRLKAIINDNWDLIRAFVNVTIGKLHSFNNFLIKALNTLKGILDIVLSFLPDWSLNLPAISVAAGVGAGQVQGPYPAAVPAKPTYSAPHDSYGAPNAFSV